MCKIFIFYIKEKKIIIILYIICSEFHNIILKKQNLNTKMFSPNS